MTLFDERQPEELDPQYEELMSLLQQANLDPMLVDPHERAHILSQARARLFPTDPEIFKLEHVTAPALREAGFFPSNPTALSNKQQHGRRLLHVLNMLAAALVVVVLLGGSLLLFQNRLPSTANHPVNATQTYATSTAQVIPTANSYDNFVATNGIMFGFDAQHTHFNPFEHILIPTTVGGLTKKWAYDTGSSVISSPTVTGGVVYIGCVCGYMYALDAATGMKKWAYSTGGSQVGDDPAVVGGVVYFGAVESHTLYALDATTGAKKWTYQTRGSMLSSPTVVGGIVYVGSDDNTLYALDAATGAKKWAYWTRGSIESSPAVAGGIVYVGAGDGNVYALDAATGAKKWAFRIGGPLGPSISSPAVAGGIVYVGSRGNVYALDAATGAKKWISLRQASTDPVLAGGLVYFGSGDGYVYALDAPTGAKKGAFRGDESTIDCSPVVADGVVYYGSLSSPLYALHLPGT